MELLPVEIEPAARRLRPVGAGRDQAPPGEPAVLVAGPRLRRLVDDEQLVEVAGAGVVARERAVGAGVEVVVVRDDDRVAGLEGLEEDAVEERGHPQLFPPRPRVAVADLVVERVAGEDRVAALVVERVVTERDLGDGLQVRPVGVEQLGQAVLVEQLPLGLRRGGDGHEGGEEDGEKANAHGSGVGRGGRTLQNRAYFHRPALTRRPTPPGGPFLRNTSAGRGGRAGGPSHSWRADVQESAHPARRALRRSGGAVGEQATAGHPYGPVGGAEPFRRRPARAGPFPIPHSPFPIPHPPLTPPRPTRGTPRRTRAGRPPPTAASSPPTRGRGA